MNSGCVGVHPKTTEWTDRISQNARAEKHMAVRSQLSMTQRVDSGADHERINARITHDHALVLVNPGSFTFCAKPVKKGAISGKIPATQIRIQAIELVIRAVCKTGGNIVLGSYARRLRS